MYPNRCKTPRLVFDAMHSVEYKYKKDYRYYPNHNGLFPVVEMYLEANGNKIEFPAIVDTGAENTLISPQYALALGLNLTDGNAKDFSTANGGQIRAYGHRVQIKILDESIDSEIFFTETTLHRCLLGRDLLEKMQIGVKESHSTLFLF